MATTAASVMPSMATFASRAAPRMAATAIVIVVLAVRTRGWGRWAMVGDWALSGTVREQIFYF